MVVGLCYDLESTYNIEDNIAYKDFSFLSEVEYVEKNLKILGHKVILINGLDLFVRDIFKYKEKCDIIFNMIEGYKSRNREGLIPAICEAFNIPYTGTDSFGLSLSLNKYHMNQIIKSLNIKVPESFLIDYPLEDMDLIASKNIVCYPCIIKPNHEGSSMGVYLINTKTELIDKIKLLAQQYEEQLIVEQYIHGPELSVGILGTAKNARIYTCLQYVYENGKNIELYDYDCKYNLEHNMICPQIAEPILEKICNDSLLIHRIMHFQDISRIDWRISESSAYLIETTPLPSFEMDSEFDIGSKLANRSFDTVLEEILSSALHRWEEKKDGKMGR